VEGEAAFPPKPSCRLARIFVGRLGISGTNAKGARGEKRGRGRGRAGSTDFLEKRSDFRRITALCQNSGLFTVF